MSGFKRILGIGLALVLLLSGLLPAASHAFAAEFILDPGALNGRDYTDSDRLAALLDTVFSGDIDVYTDMAYTAEVSMPVGTSLNIDTLYHVRSQTTGNRVSGWQCYIYANAVYNKLFREWVGHANGFSHSRVVIPGGSDTMTYELLRDRGVRCGAYLRTTNRSDGSYNGSIGHSMIILAYDSASITYLEGNADGNGLVRVTVRSWSDFNQRQLSGRGRYISHMVQPTDTFYNAQFPSCGHPVFDSAGACTGCGYVFDWESTFDPWVAGTYRLTEAVTPRVSMPYASAPAAEFTVGAGETVNVLGQYRNGVNQLWYVVSAGGSVCYINSTSMSLVEYLPLEVSCSGFFPEDGAVLDQKSYPVKGTVSANYPLKMLVGYLDGEEYALWYAPDERTTQVNLRQTDMNHRLTFSKLERGKHTITLMAQSFVHGPPVVIHESSFYTVSDEPCTHDYEETVTQDATCTVAGLMTYTCRCCPESYTRPISPYGHQYEGAVCKYCGLEQVPVELTGTLTLGGSPEEPVKVTLRGENGKIYTVTTGEGGFTIPGILPGNYAMEVTKADCVPVTAWLVLMEGTVQCDVKLCVPGDASADGRLNIGDVVKIYAHIRGAGKLQDAYALLCADLNEDGAVNIGDAGRLYAKIRNNT